MRGFLGRGLLWAMAVAVLVFAPASALAATGAALGFHVVKLHDGASVGISKTFIVSVHKVNLASLSRRGLGPTNRGAVGTMPRHVRFSAQAFAAMKALASHNANAPRFGLFSRASSLSLNIVSPDPKQHVTGMTDNGIICSYFGSGCQPPDMAVAASPNWLVQATNTSVAVFDKNGVMVFGYPVDFPTFFGVPSPGLCTFNPAGIPFTTDPRAFYDPNDQRFFIAMEAPNGVADSCTPSSTAYIAVSQTSDPSAGWNVYSVNSALAKPDDFDDYTQLGFDSQAVYIGGNQFPCCTAGYDGAFTIILDKHGMEAGASIAAPNVIGPYTSTSSPTCPGGGCLLDTVNPTTSVARLSQQPGATILVSADQSNPSFPCGFGGITCKNLDVFAISNPLSLPSVSEKTVTLPNFFVLPPNGDQPGCIRCIETIDNRVSGTPTYSPVGGGRVSFALETGVNFGLATYPGYTWGELAITETGGTLTSATLRESGFIAGTNMTNSFPATQLTPIGDLFVVSDIMSTSTYPGWVYRLQRAGDPLGALRAPKLVQPGLDIFGGSRWGDFEATSYDGFWTNNVWLASQYGNTDYDWGTSMAKVH